MATCPNGHASQAADYCDVCGEIIGTASGPASGPASGTARGAAPGASGPSGARPCPDCGTPGTDRFCEQCGYDFATGGGRPTPRTEKSSPSRPSAPATGPSRPQPAPPIPQPPAPQPPGPQQPSAPQPAGVVWTAVVTADREYFARVLAEGGPDAGSLTFPPYAPERRFALTGPQVRVGRRGGAQPSPPEIDLREPPADPGVSHLHAVLLAKPDGTWTLVDPGSTNRTCVNGSTEPIPYNTEVPVGDGDRIHVGAWTTITLIRGEAT